MVVLVEVDELPLLQDIVADLPQVVSSQSDRDETVLVVEMQLGHLPFDHLDSVEEPLGRERQPSLVLVALEAVDRLVRVRVDTHAHPHSIGVVGEVSHLDAQEGGVFLVHDRVKRQLLVHVLSVSVPGLPAWAVPGRGCGVARRRLRVRVMAKNQSANDPNGINT